MSKFGFEVFDHWVDVIVFPLQKEVDVGNM